MGCVTHQLIFLSYDATLYVLFTSSTFIFAHIPFSHDLVKLLQLTKTWYVFAAILVPDVSRINPHTRAKLGLLFNNIYTLSGSAGKPIIVAPIKLSSKAKKHFGFLPPNRNGTFYRVLCFPEIPPMAATLQFLPRIKHFLLSHSRLHCYSRKEQSLLCFFFGLYLFFFRISSFFPIPGLLPVKFIQRVIIRHCMFQVFLPR